jgi:hypothetical protein
LFKFICEPNVRIYFLVSSRYHKAMKLNELLNFTFKYRIKEVPNNRIRENEEKMVLISAS